MSLDGAGLYQPPAPEFPAIPNTTILANDFNTIILDIAATLSQAIFRDGQAAFTANQSMGSHKLTNLAMGTNLADAVNVLQVFFDPSFIATTIDGFQVTGTTMKALVNNMVLTALTLLDMSASGEVKLPSNTSIGPVSATELALLNGLLATTAELNKLAGALITTAELNNLHGVTSSTAELNILDGVVTSTAELNRLHELFTEFNFLAGVTSSVQTQLDGKAYLTSPNFTGVPTAPTAPAYTATNQLATTDFVMGQSMLAGTIPSFLLNNAGII